MFQKLYRLLEHIDDNTRRQSEGLHDTARVIKQLETQIAVRNQLDASGATQPPARSAESAARSAESSTGPAKMNSLYLIISCLVFIALLASCYLIFHLSHSMQKMTRQADEAAALQTYSFTRYKELNSQLTAANEEVARLDSIIRQQNQAINELKKLNETAVKTFVYIRKDLQHIIRQSLDHHLTGSDYGHTFGSSPETHRFGRLYGDH